MWINFLPIFQKQKRKTDFPKIYDSQYHQALVETIAFYKQRHVVTLKKRQWAASYFHMAKLINYLWFEEGITMKLIGSSEDFINLKGDWAFLEGYRDFLNEHTAWTRYFNPSKVLSWQQRIETTDGYKGLNGRLMGISTQQSATKGVGGPSLFVIHEEAGIAPKMGESYEYVRPALSDGQLFTGQFIAYGSVGDLKQCEPLKDYMESPEENGFFGIETRFYDNEGRKRVCGFFVPEQWSMEPYIDKYGNSLVEDALEAIKKEREAWEKELDPAKYQLRVSQKPISVQEAFATRNESYFPRHLVEAQKQRIKDNWYPFEHIKLERNKDGRFDVLPDKREPISDFPVKMKAENKEGCLVVYKRPPKEKPDWGTYYASIDPVGEGSTSTSVSLCSIIVYKNDVEVTRLNDEGEYETFVEGGQVVAEWCGRFDDINETHQKLLDIIEWYNAWTVIEANIPQFITYMTLKKKIHYIVPSNQLIFTKQVDVKQTPNHPYGWKNIGTLFTVTMLPYLLAYCKEIIGYRKSDSGAEIPIYGIERIPSLMCMVEMGEYYKGLNVDRVVSLCALICFVEIQKANGAMLKKRVTESNLEKSPKNTKLYKGPFSSVGRQSTIRRSPFSTIK